MSNPNLSANQRPIERHPFGTFFNADTRILMMGTLPPTPDKWCMPFHYPNFYNDMWRIFGLVFFNDANYFRMGEEKRFEHHKIQAFLLQKGIGECPSVVEAIREKGNASDDHLTIVKTVDLAAILPQVPKVKWIFTTGGKATEVLLGIINEELAKHTPNYQPIKLPKTNEYLTVRVFNRTLMIYRLPSSSRAYPISLANKAAAYRQFFELAGLLDDQPDAQQ